MLEEMAYNLIKGNIMSGKYTSGMVISDNEISKELGMSRTPIRAAINRLFSEGFILQRKGHFSTVRILTPQDIINFFEVSLVFEEFSVRKLYLEQINIDLENMSRIIERQKNAISNHDSLLYSKYDHEFHLSLTNILKNEEITKLMNNLWEKIQMVLCEQVSVNGIVIGTESVIEHQKILNALASNEPIESVLKYIYQHNNNAKERVLLRR